MPAATTYLSPSSTMGRVAERAGGAMLRSMLTHPDAGKEVRAAIAEQQRQVAAALPADDAVLRAGLIGALTIGALVSRHLLELEGVRDAGPGRRRRPGRGRRP